jgi:hypothetical protein
MIKRSMFHCQSLTSNSNKNCSNCLKKNLISNKCTTCLKTKCTRTSNQKKWWDSVFSISTKSQSGQTHIPPSKTIFLPVHNKWSSMKAKSNCHSLKNSTNPEKEDFTKNKSGKHWSKELSTWTCSNPLTAFPTFQSQARPKVTSKCGFNSIAKATSLKFTISYQIKKAPLNKSL